jgi:ABC-type transport system involved in cytochrome c biogenesis permease subunit
MTTQSQSINFFRKWLSNLLADEIGLLKLLFLVTLSLNVAIIYVYLHSKFRDIFIQKSSNFFYRANYTKILMFIAMTSFCESLPGEIEDFPVLYKGRFRPAETYAKLWLYDLYGAQTIRPEDLRTFHQSNPSALNILWQLNRLGYQSFETAPLFWIPSAEVKQLADLDLLKNRFSYQELSHSDIVETISTHKEFFPLLQKLREFSLIKSQTNQEQVFENRLKSLQAQGIPAKKIAVLLEQEFPLLQRLKQSGTLFQALPSRYGEGEWFPLNALTIQVFDQQTNSLKPIGNFTIYSNQNFENIQKNYLDWQNNQPDAYQKLISSLKQSYEIIAGLPYQEAAGKTLYYPTQLQLYTEYKYYQFPWIKLLITLYGLSAIFFICFNHFSSLHLKKTILVLFLFTFILHTCLLLCRCYILNRPPVANMFETVIYVPWIAGLLSLVLAALRRHTSVLLAASLSSLVLLIILELTDLNQSLEPVQAVLDSQFWLLIHVLLVVGSYGVFILGSFLAHFYLSLSLKDSSKKPFMQSLAQLILQTLYVGTALLITGTILGGVWAAESWGRFWDWDPKESWAFISSCLYLICIHAYRFNRIGDFGLAMGSICGFLAISFTWYGVNYILGTGLHSYGFGSGGEKYYYLFLIAEMIFLFFICIFKSQLIMKNNSKQIQ